MKKQVKIELSFVEKNTGYPIDGVRIKINKNENSHKIIKTSSSGNILLLNEFQEGDSIGVSVEKTTGEFKKIYHANIESDDMALVFLSPKSKISAETEIHRGQPVPRSQLPKSKELPRKTATSDVLDRMSEVENSSSTTSSTTSSIATRSSRGHPKLKVTLSGSHEASTTSNSTQKKIENLLFPLFQRPKESYKEGARRFGSNRGKGRKHAGIDLYAPVGTPVRAMADGVVLSTEHFYCGAHAIEVAHENFIARYGEVSKSNIKVKRGDKVRRGQVLAEVGKLAGIAYSMLHLEMFETTKSPSVKTLTQYGVGPYMRREDLMDPTSSIDNAVMD